MYEAVIGLEVHIHLKTKSKAFCGCSTEFGNPANSQVCPVCLGFPWSLPVLNRQALEYAIKVGWYDSDTGERLPVAGSVDNSVTLTAHGAK